MPTTFQEVNLGNNPTNVTISRHGTSDLITITHGNDMSIVGIDVDELRFFSGNQRAIVYPSGNNLETVVEDIKDAIRGMDINVSLEEQTTVLTTEYPFPSVDLSGFQLPNYAVTYSGSISELNQLSQSNLPQSSKNNSVEII